MEQQELKNRNNNRFGYENEKNYNQNCSTNSQSNFFPIIPKKNFNNDIHYNIENSLNNCLEKNGIDEDFYLDNVDKDEDDGEIVL